MKFDNIGSGYYLVQDSQRRRAQSLDQVRVILLSSQLNFDFYFTQALDQSFYAGGAQGLD
jgi:hypothetical protein